jgi:hypothetical protein
VWSWSWRWRQRGSLWHLQWMADLVELGRLPSHWDSCAVFRPFRAMTSLYTRLESFLGASMRRWSSLDPESWPRTECLVGECHAKCQVNRWALRRGCDVSERCCTRAMVESRRCNGVWSSEHPKRVGVTNGGSTGMAQCLSVMRRAMSGVVCLRQPGSRFGTSLA